MDLESLILNWCRWHWRDMRWHRNSVHSIEGRWRSPQPWDAPPITPLGKVDQQQAIAVETAWRALPHLEKLLLKWHYVFKRQPQVICSDLRRHGFLVKTIDYDTHRLRAENNLQKQLHTGNLSSSIRSKIVVAHFAPRWEGAVLPQESEASA